MSLSHAASGVTKGASFPTMLNSFSVADGSMAFSRDGRVTIPALPVDQVVDTTGAGDAYAAGLLSRLSHGAGIQEAMKRGAELAARVIGKLGSQP